MTATARNKSGFFIGVTCPGCGGGLEIQSDFFVITCEHCGSHLRIVMPDSPPVYLVRAEKPFNEIRFQIDRYLKQHNLPLTGSDLEIRKIYYPYWKVDAVVLKVRNKILERHTGQLDNTEQEITYEQRVTDIHLSPYTSTMAAGKINNYIPQTIGMRAEYIKMVPFSKENVEEDFDCLPIELGWNQIENNLHSAINAIGKISMADFGKNKTELFHPTGSLLYFPYYIVESSHSGTTRLFILDGWTGRVIKYLEESPDEFEWGDFDYSSHESSSLRVDFHRCGNCGFDLPTGQSYIYICDNCKQLILMDNFSLTEGNLLIAEAEINANDKLFPFWSFELNESDAARVRPLIGGIYNSSRMVIPAFKQPNFEAMYKLSKRISAAAARINLMPLVNVDSRFGRVTLGLNDALTLAEVVLYREMLEKGLKPSVEDSKLKPAGINLFYAPFHPESYFYVDSVMGAITFERKSAETILT